MYEAFHLLLLGEVIRPDGVNKAEMNGLIDSLGNHTRAYMGIYKEFEKLPDPWDEQKIGNNKFLDCGCGGLAGDWCFGSWRTKNDCLDQNSCRSWIEHYTSGGDTTTL